MQNLLNTIHWLLLSIKRKGGVTAPPGKHVRTMRLYTHFFNNCFNPSICFFIDWKIY